MYINFDAKCDYFTYKRDVYSPGTQVVYNGKCYINETETVLQNQIVTWLYCENGKHYFKRNGTIYTCPSWEFTNRIVKIAYNPSKQSNVNKQEQNTEIYWTNSMVAKTLWYIIIMLAAVIFNDRIVIWILATIIWYTSTFKNK